MKKIIFYVLFVIFVLVLGIVIINLSSNFLRRSNEQIRENILKMTPIGMSMGNAAEIIKNNKKWYDFAQYDEGVVYDKRLKRPTAHANYTQKDSENFDIIGKKSISIYAGDYHVFLAKVYVRVWWAFDEEFKLIDVIIEKDVSGF